jgi:hypothetical protein
MNVDHHMVIINNVNTYLQPVGPAMKLFLQNKGEVVRGPPGHQSQRIMGTSTLKSVKVK